LIIIISVEKAKYQTLNKKEKQELPENLTTESFLLYKKNQKFRIIPSEKKGFFSNKRQILVFFPSKKK